MFDQRAQDVHLLVQIRAPDVAYALAGDALSTVLSAHRILLHLCAVGEAHARLLAVQPRAAGRRANAGCCTQTAAETGGSCLEAVLVVAEQVEVVGLRAAAEAGVLHVLVLLLLLLLLLLRLLLRRLLRLLLLVHGGVEVGEGVGEVVAWKPAAVGWHRVRLMRRGRTRW